MKKQSGFTLIELLLVLAIIGIISAIAIPALLGQRARARDKSAVSNADSVIADLVSQWDRQKESGTAAAAGSDLIGTSTSPLIPQIWTATNPWATSGAATAYSTAFAAETAATPGTVTEAQATSSNMGQVQLGFLAPVANVAGVVAASTFLNTPFQRNSATTFNYTKVAGID